MAGTNVCGILFILLKAAPAWAPHQFCSSRSYNLAQSACECTSHQQPGTVKNCSALKRRRS